MVTITAVKGFIVQVPGITNRRVTEALKSSPCKHFTVIFCFQAIKITTDD